MKTAYFKSTLLLGLSIRRWLVWNLCFGLNARALTDLATEDGEHISHFRECPASLLRSRDASDAVPQLHSLIVPEQELVLEGRQLEPRRMLEQVGDELVVAFQGQMQGVHFRFLAETRPRRSETELAVSRW